MTRMTATLLLAVGCVESEPIRVETECGTCWYESDVDWCDGRDNDCDCVVDEDCSEPPRPAGESPPRGREEPECSYHSDCNDDDPETRDRCVARVCVHTPEEPTPEPEEEPCEITATSDCDNDGSSWIQGDCDDRDPTVARSLPEDEAHENLWDGKDNDCDGVADECRNTDADMDQDRVPDELDCDPVDPRRWSMAPEFCDDGLDSDCDGGDNTTARGEDCHESAGLIDVTQVVQGAIRVIINGQIESGLAEDPVGEITNIVITSTEVDAEWSHPWEGNRAQYDMGFVNRSVALEVRLEADEPTAFDLFKWRATSALPHVPACTGVGGVVLRAP